MISVVLFFIIIILGGVPYHNLNLYLTSRGFNKIHNPIETRSLKKYAEIEHYGNSNLCDYMIGEFRQSFISRENIKKNYASTSVVNFDMKKLPIEIYFLDEDIFQYEPMSHWLQDSGIATSSKDVYLVYIEALSYPPTNDYRCH